MGLGKFPKGGPTSVNSPNQPGNSVPLASLGFLPSAQVRGIASPDLLQFLAPAQMLPPWASSSLLPLISSNNQSWYGILVCEPSGLRL